MTTDRNMIVAMFACQAITALCAIFVAIKVAQVVDGGEVSTSTGVYIMNRDPIQVRVIGGSVRLEQ